MGEPIQALTDATALSSTQQVRSTMWAPFMSHMPPPVARSRNQGARAATPKGLYHVSVANTGVPKEPSWSSPRAAMVLAKYRCEWPTRRWTPALSTAAVIRSHSSRVSAMGFSRKTCLPAEAAAIVADSWRKFGSAIIATATSARSSAWR